GGRLEHPRAANERAPNIRNFGPVRFGLWFDANAPTDDGAECCEGRDGHVIWRALQTGRDVISPWCHRIRQKFGTKRLNGSKAGRKGLGLRPLFVRLLASILSAPIPISSVPAALSGALARRTVHRFIKRARIFVEYAHDPTSMRSLKSAPTRRGVSRITCRPAAVQRRAHSAALH